jgi:hypothetical protein
MLPKYDEQDYFEFIAAQMRNYMLYIIRHKDFRPKHYKPNLGHTIQSHHVARFYGIHMARMIQGFPSIEDTWNTRESLKHVAAAVESMTKDAYTDMYPCMHFSDDWETAEDSSDEIYWEELYPDPKYEPSPEVERHRRKFEHIEDGAIQLARLQEKFGVSILLALVSRLAAEARRGKQS